MGQASFSLFPFYTATSYNGPDWERSRLAGQRTHSHINPPSRTSRYDGGSFTNFEYGVAIEDPAYVKIISADIKRYAYLGGTLSLQRLKDLAIRVTELKAAIQEEQRSIRTKLRTAAILEREAEEQLLRSRVEGRSIYTVFGDTILYLLAKGPMTTTALHVGIQGIHPDLCDDSLDRVIDGQQFGKLWKHQVRTAQQHLKRTNLISYDPTRHLWALSSPS